MDLILRKRHRNGLILLIILLLPASSLHAKIFKWVDENGKTHFGDSVPEKYKKSQKEIVHKIKHVEEKTSSTWKPTSTCSNPLVCDPNSSYNQKQKRIDQKRKSEYLEKQKQAEKALAKDDRDARARKEYKQTYEYKLEQYERSVECYASRGTRFSGEGQGYRYNAGCGNVKKPKPP